MPADRQHPVARDLDLEDQQHKAEQDQQDAGGADRQHLEGEKRQQQADAAGDTRQDGARGPELDRQPERAEHQQQVGDLRVGQRAQHLLRPRHLDRVRGRARRCGASRSRPSKRVTRPAVELRQEVRHVGRDEVDERRLGVERLLLGVGPALGDRLLDQLDVALALRRRASARSRRRPRPSSSPSPRRPSGRRPTTGMRGADVRAGRHRGDVGGDGDEEAGRRRARPGGPTNTATGVLAAMMAVLMSRVESTRPPGVRSVMTSTAAPAASASAIAPRRYSADTGWMMPSTSARYTTGTAR